MNNQKSSGVFTGFVAVIGVVVGVVIGFTIWHASADGFLGGSGSQQGVGTSATGTTFNTAKITEIVMAPTSNAASSTSVLNGDASDRYVLDGGVSCTGLTNMFGAASLAEDLWYAGTSSVAAPTASISGRALLAMKVSLATSTTYGFIATSTYTNTFARIWAAGTYMVFETNATSSAVSCQPFLHYIGS